jgi:ABC-type branched-subunit amino acid transport system ATPase component/ABC-type branched-subunit amino acid transport system permease subunit
VRASIPLRALAIGVIVALADAALPDYTEFLFARIALLVIVTLSLSLLIGVAGLLSLAGAAFMGIGAYGLAVWQLHTSLPILLGLVVVVLVAWAAGWLLGTIAMRVSGFYLALATLGMLIAFQTVIQHGGSLLGEGYGLVAPPPRVAGQELSVNTLSVTAAFLAAAIIVLTASLLDSRLGRGWRTMKANEVAAELCGVNLLRMRTSAFALSAAMAALAGCVYGPLLQAVSPGSFDIDHTVDLLVYSVVGGLGTVLGSVLGPVVLELTPEVLRPLQEYRPLFFGAVLILILIVSPKGLGHIVGRAVDRTGLTRRLRRRAAPAALPERGIALAALRPRAVVPDPEAPAVQFQNVTVRYGGLTAVDGLSLTVRPRSLHGLIGPNGAGKTTAINALSGLVRLEDGTIHSGGELVRRRGGGIPAFRLADVGIARTFQTPLLVPELTAVENVMVGLHSRLRAGVVSGSLKLGRTRREEAAARVLSLEALDRVDFGEDPDRPIRSLPFGALRRLEIARAIVSDPRVLLLDEPTSGLEMAAAEAILQMLRGLQRDREAALTIVIVEHNVPLLFTHCDTVTAMVDGRDVITSVPDDLRRDPRVRASYLGDQIEAEAAVGGSRSQEEAGGVEAL